METEIADQEHSQFGDFVLAQMGPKVIPFLVTEGIHVRGYDLDIAHDRLLLIGEDVAAGTPGELIIRNPVVMPGYWANEKGTAEALRDGWLYTGDMGYFDNDGFLTLKDRSKDVIISGGTNIYPREIEEVLLTHPAVDEISVIGRYHPDWGEELVPFFALSSKPEPDTTELDAHCLKHLARFKRPKAYFFVEALPKNNNGKVLKTELRELVK